MIDASTGYMKDGNKNRLRTRDIHKIVDVFNKRLELPKYSRMVPFEAIERNEFNLNIPRYIDSQQAEDIQDIEGHLRGGIPSADVDALECYWTVCPRLRQALFKDNRPGYLHLAVAKESIKPAIYEHPEFVTFIDSMNALFADWRKKSASTLQRLQTGCHPKQVIADLSEDLLAHYSGKPLIDNYDVFQHLMDYWAETMQDDCYLIAGDGWKAETSRVLVKEQAKVRKWTRAGPATLCQSPSSSPATSPPSRRLSTKRGAELENITAQMTEMEEEYGGEEGAFAELDKVNKANITTRLKEIKGDKEAKEEAQALNAWLKICNQQAELKRALKEAEEKLDALTYTKYPTLTEEEIKTLVVDDKWLAAFDAAIHGEMDRISQVLTQRVKELAERYKIPLPKQVGKVDDLEQIVNRHLERMGFSWK